MLQKTSTISMTVPTPPPSYSVTVDGSGTWTFYASGTTEYKFEVVSVAGVGGTWTVTPSTGTVSTGSHTISFTMHGEGLDVSWMTSGGHQVADIYFYTR